MHKNTPLTPGFEDANMTNPDNSGMTLAALLFTAGITAVLVLGVSLAHYTQSHTCDELPEDPRQAPISQLEERFGVDAATEIALAENASVGRIRAATAKHRGFDKCSSK